MFRKIITGLAIVLLPTCLLAQTKVLKYANGNKAFVGRMIMAWPEIEKKDLMPSTPQVNYGDGRSFNNDFEELRALIGLLPEAVYDGKCTFYLPDGKKWFSGKYRYGVKQGKFQYWHTNGQLAATQHYQNGIADGHWQLWDSTGRQIASYSYRAIPDSLLRKMNMALMYSFAEDGFNIAQSEGADSVFRSFLEHSLSALLPDGLSNAYRDKISVFQHYVENNLIRKTLWDGNFKVWSDGEPYMEFAFKNNRPEGIWKLWQNGKTVFELVLKNGGVVSVNDYEDAGANEDYARILERQSRNARALSSANNHNDEDPSAVDPGVIEPRAVDPNIYRGPEEHSGGANNDGSSEAILTFTQEAAQFPGGPLKLIQFIKDHLQYPKEAIEKNIQGKVVVQFVVTKSGKIDLNSIKILRSVAPQIDAEAKRIVAQMPDWLPAKNDGKPVNAYYVIPVTFKL